MSRNIIGLGFLISLAGAGIFLGPAACRAERDPFRLEKDTPIVLIMVDTLRAESLGLYGYDLDTSPVLDQFAETAYVFENGTTQCNATLPSITSTLTGLYVRTHRNYISVPVEGMVRPDASIRALPERMQEGGYETIATISHPSWRKAPESPGFSRGWDLLTIIPEDIPIELRPLAATGQYTNQRTFDSLAQWERANRLRAEARAAGEQGALDQKPLFLLSHYFDPHSDIEHNLYVPPEAYWNLYLRHHLEKAQLAHHAEKPIVDYYDELAPLSPIERHRFMTRTEEHVDVRRSLSLAYGRALYDAEVRYLDYEIDRLFDRLKVMGIYDDALIVIMSDHGENMTDDSELHGSIAFSHKRLWEGVAHTPMLIRLPGQKEGHRIDALVQNIDVAPTVLQLLGLPADEKAEGKSLVPLLKDPGGTLHERVFIESSDHVERAIKTDEYKYVSPGPDREPLLFRYRDDPLEMNDVKGEVPQALLDTFASELDDFKPHETMHVRFLPAPEPYAAAFDLDLEFVEFRAAVVLGGAGKTVMSEDKKSVTVEVQVAQEAVDVVLGTQRRNARLNWTFRMEDANGSPLKADAIADRIFLGPLALRRSHALPHWNPTADAGLAAPERPSMVLSRVGDQPAFDLVLQAAAGTTANFESEMRYHYPAYSKGIVVESSEGLGDLVQDGGMSFKLTGKAERAAARLVHHPKDGGVRFLNRIDGEWPRFDDSVVDGRAAAVGALGFTMPFPLDSRVTTALLAEPAAEAPPGAIQIWIDVTGGSATTIDRSKLTEKQIAELEALGYLERE